MSTSASLKTAPHRRGGTADPRHAGQERPFDSGKTAGNSGGSRARRIATGARRRAEQGPPSADPVESAKAAGLRYVSADAPGIRRVRAGKSFKYVAPNGKP